MLLIGLLILAFLAWRWSKRRGSPLGIPGKLLYADGGRRSRLYSSKRYRINAKPDFIIRLPSGENAIAEYKDRANRVYESDIVQVLSSVLAVREHMPLQRAYVVTRNGKQEIPLPADNDEIYRRIERNVTWARQVKKKELIMVGCRNKGACHKCSLKHACELKK